MRSFLSDWSIFVSSYRLSVVHLSLSFDYMFVIFQTEKVPLLCVCQKTLSSIFDMFLLQMFYLYSFTFEALQMTIYFTKDK